MEIRANAKKVKNIGADLLENTLNSGYFITTLHRNFRQTFKCTLPPPPPRKHQPRTPMRLGTRILNYVSQFYTYYL
jgi:hypothetical protein